MTQHVHKNDTSPPCNGTMCRRLSTTCLFFCIRALCEHLSGSECLRGSGFPHISRAKVLPSPEASGSSGSTGEDAPSTSATVPHTFFGSITVKPRTVGCTRGGDGRSLLATGSENPEEERVLQDRVARMKREVISCQHGAATLNLFQAMGALYWYCRTCC